VQNQGIFPSRRTIDFEKDFWPPPSLILVLRPGDLLRALREQLLGI
jgi:hypothetical protein